MFLYYLFALFGLSCAIWHLKVMKTNRHAEKDGQWVYIITAKLFFIFWAAFGMFSALRYGAWITLIVPLLAAFGLEFLIQTALRYAYLSRPVSEKKPEKAPENLPRLAPQSAS